MASIIAEGKQQYFDNAGLPLVGGKLYTYAAGTTTLKATYSDAAATVPNTNPVILNSRGEALIYWSGSYKVILKDALDNTIWTVDNIVETNLDYRTSSTGSVVVPAGTTVQRDGSPLPGYFRYNVDLGSFEGRYAAAWTSIPKSVNGVAVPDGGDIILKTVGGVAIAGAGDVAFKTVNGVSVVGAGAINVTSAVPRTPRTANSILVGADNSTLIDVTGAGGFTQTVTAAATLGAGWSAWYRNGADANITIDPNGAETINGAATLVIPPGASALLECDGTNLYTPIFLSASTGASMTLLSVTVPTASANVDLLSTFSAKYDNYKVIGQGIKVTSASDTLNLRVANAGAADSGANYVQILPNTNMAVGSTTTSTSVGPGTTTAGTINFTLEFRNMNAASLKTIDSDSTGGPNNSSQYGNVSNHCVYTNAAVVSGFRLYWSGGSNFQAAGKIYVWGYNNT